MNHESNIKVELFVTLIMMRSGIQCLDESFDVEFQICTLKAKRKRQVHAPTVWPAHFTGGENIIRCCSILKYCGSVQHQQAKGRWKPFECWFRLKPTSKACWKVFICVKWIGRQILSHSNYDWNYIIFNSITKGNSLFVPNFLVTCRSLLRQLQWWSNTRGLSHQ